MARGQMHEKRDLIALADIVSSVTNAFLVSYVIHIANIAARIEMKRGMTYPESRCRSF